jgi:AcrR family transcriptional regulator
MKPNNTFLNQPLTFWAHVRAISESVGYAERGEGTIKIPILEDMLQAMRRRDLQTQHLLTTSQRPTKLSRLLEAYFQYRAEVPDEYVQPRLMDEKRARNEFRRLRAALRPSENCPLPMNKQKGKKRAKAYLTGIVNMIIEANAQGMACDYDPRALTIVTNKGIPLRTLARRVDGAFPSTTNPIAVWEIKEYYYTTTFGSRVADAVYETLLDGMELAELRSRESVHVKHYLIIDARYTWWDCGRSYLCRIIDALHMGYVDEVLFGYEVIERLPEIVKQWVETLKKTGVS